MKPTDEQIELLAAAIAFEDTSYHKPGVNYDCLRYDGKLKYIGLAKLFIKAYNLLIGEVE